LILTAPSGQTYVTTAGSALLFPRLCQATGAIAAPEVDTPDDHCGQRTAMMPKRSKTRAQNRAHRITAERRQNRQARATRPAHCINASGPAPPDDNPPPF
ncbi:MAG TPA: hypothetical protein VE400_22805, partial [Mycobacterium sp.]|nr:hypothetical protein [Mycobacterium sp.]